MTKYYSALLGLALLLPAPLLAQDAKPAAAPAADSAEPTVGVEPLKLELQHFLRLCQDGPGEHREALDGLTVVRTLDRLTVALKSGSPA